MSNSDQKKKTGKSVKFLLAPRPQKDPLAADYEAPQHVLVPKDGSDIEEIKKQLPDFDPKVFTSKEETKKGMLERAHNADGITFDPDLLQAMSKDFDYEDPNNILNDDFMEQAGGLIEDEGEMLDGEMTDLTNELFEDEPEVITFDELREDEDDSSQNSDDYDVDHDGPSDDEKKEPQTSREPVSNSGFGKKLILFKKKANKQPPLEIAPSAQSAKELQDELNAFFKPENQRLLLLKSKATELAGQRDFDQCSEVDSELDEKRTVFSNYSMTSSVMRRSQGLEQIDEHFERLYEKEYADDTEIGALDLNDVQGEELLKHADQIRQLKNEIKVVRKRNFGDDYEPEIVSEHHKTAIIGEDPAAEDEDLVEVEFQRRENRVDCESVLTYNSTLYNHPKLIIEPRRKSTSQSTTDQMEVCSDVRSRSGGAQSIASSRATVISKLSFRPQDESAEDRRARKKALKQYRHERRQERKQNQQIFKSEKANLVKQQRTNMPALRLA